jgi:hypothetical protein
MSFLGDIIESVLGARLPETQPASKWASKWASPAHHIATLDSASCECGAAKRVGDYRCATCARGKR